MHRYKLLILTLVVVLASAALPSCSPGKPKIVHLDFADDIYVAGPTMAERATGHPKIDSSEKVCELFFLVNETDPQYYADSVIERFIDTSQLVRKAMAKGYHELRLHFYHRSKNTDELLRTRRAGDLSYCDKDMVSEYAWSDGKPEGTLYYENGWPRGEPLKLEDMRSKKKAQ